MAGFRRLPMARVSADTGSQGGSFRCQGLPALHKGGNELDSGKDLPKGGKGASSALSPRANRLKSVGILEA